MKKYLKPVARKIDYSFDIQVTASSAQVQPMIGGYGSSKCTWGDGTCNVIFNEPKARGLDNCRVQGS